MTFVNKYLAWGAGVLALLIALVFALPGGKARGFDVSGFGNSQDFRFEAHLVGIGDKLIQGLHEKLGDRAPEKPLHRPVSQPEYVSASNSLFVSNLRR